MAATIQPAALTLPAAPVRGPVRAPLVAPPMTRCECAGVPFEEVARHLEEHGLGVEDVFVHHSEIRADGFRTLAEGDKVRFEITQSPKGPRAANVTPIR